MLTSVAMQQVREAIQAVAPTDATVLLQGETGTGKELAAREIHAASRRHQHPLVAVSCVALTTSLMTSELFGHEAGAFTGATKRHIGRFEQAQNGTLFLDEIGEIQPDTQAMLLRVLQERQIERVGGASLPLNVRLIAATNRNLMNEVREGRFRQDLFYRLNVFPITLPPLRQRREDIPELAAFFVKQFAEREQRSPMRITPAAMKLLQQYDWPGNIRELQNIIERGVIISRDGILQLDPSWLFGSAVSETAQTWAAQEKQRILDALRASDGRIYGPGGAAHRLGLNPTTLYGKMRKHGIQRTSGS